MLHARKDKEKNDLIYTIIHEIIMVGRALVIMADTIISKMIVILMGYASARFSFFQSMFTEEGLSSLGRILDISVALFAFAILILMLLKEIKRLHKREDNFDEKRDESREEYKQIIKDVTNALVKVAESQEKSTKALEKNALTSEKLLKLMDKVEIRMKDMEGK